MSSFDLSNYPPGVTGNEYEIAGPDYERETDDFLCPNCGGIEGLEAGYHHVHWIDCLTCDHRVELGDDYGPDPDEAYDRMRERPTAQQRWAAEMAMHRLVPDRG
jgi:hypothetical protein